MDKLIRVTKPKSDSGVRVVPIPDDIVIVLREYKLTLGTPGRVYVFPNEQGGHRRPDGIDQHFRRVCQRLGFVGYTFHSLRHTAITDWRTDGVDLEVAAALAGHGGVKITAEVYSEATIERKRGLGEGQESRMMNALPWGKPPQNDKSGETSQRFYRFLMLVPGTGDDPVTSCRHAQGDNQRCLRSIRKG